MVGALSVLPGGRKRFGLNLRICHVICRNEYFWTFGWSSNDPAAAQEKCARPKLRQIDTNFIILDRAAPFAAARKFTKISG